MFSKILFAACATDCKYCFLYWRFRKFRAQSIHSEYCVTSHRLKWISDVTQKDPTAFNSRSNRAETSIFIQTHNASNSHFFLLDSLFNDSVLRTGRPSTLECGFSFYFVCCYLLERNMGKFPPPMPLHIHCWDWRGCSTWMRPSEKKEKYFWRENEKVETHF